MKIRLTVELSDDDRRVIDEASFGEGKRKADRYDCTDYVLRAMRERIEEDRAFYQEMKARRGASA